MHSVLKTGPDAIRSTDRRSAHGLRMIGSLLLIAFLMGCSSNPKITRTEADETIDVSGFWNDSDSRMVSEEMVQDSLARIWIDEWREATGKKPAVIVGSVRNRSSEHINTRTFVKDLERAFVNSGRVRVVASSDERGGLREEGIDTIIDAAGGIAVRFYQVELELVNLESNEKVWIGQKKIKKVVEKSRFRL